MVPGPDDEVLYRKRKFVWPEDGAGVNVDKQWLARFWCGVDY